MLLTTPVMIFYCWFAIASRSLTNIFKNHITVSSISFVCNFLLSVSRRLALGSVFCNSTNWTGNISYLLLNRCMNLACAISLRKSLHFFFLALLLLFVCLKMRGSCLLSFLQSLFLLRTSLMVLNFLKVSPAAWLSKGSILALQIAEVSL